MVGLTALDGDRAAAQTPKAEFKSSSPVLKRAVRAGTAFEPRCACGGWMPQVVGFDLACFLTSSATGCSRLGGSVPTML